MDARARARARRSSAYALERAAEVAGPDAPRPARRRAPRRARLVRARRRPPARRRRDPRPRGRLRPRRPPLRAAADAPPRRRRPPRARRSPSTTRATTSTACRRARRRCARCSRPDGRPLPRVHPRALQAARTTGRRAGRRRTSSSRTTTRSAATSCRSSSSVDDDGRVADLRFSGHGCAISPGGRLDGLRRGHGHAGRRAAARSTSAFVLDLLGIDISATRMKCALLSLKVLKSAALGGAADVAGRRTSAARGR